MRQFGGAAYALAGYNAGEHRVVRWRAERPGLPIDEWIDDIPFPETQNYVKRILGTAEDYRRLYGGGVLTPRAVGRRSALAPPRRRTPRRRRKRAGAGPEEAAGHDAARAADAAPLTARRVRTRNTRAVVVAELAPQPRHLVDRVDGGLARTCARSGASAARRA